MTLDVEGLTRCDVSEVVPGLLRVKVPLPFPPTTVNAWLLAGRNGWTLVDSGVDDEQTRAIFTELLSHPMLEGRPIERLLVTHFHPDHVGLAGWLQQQTGAPIHMSRIEWLQARLLLNERPVEIIQQLVEHARRCAAPDDYLELLTRRGPLFHKWVSPLPRCYHRVSEGDRFDLLGSPWQVMIAEGHAPEMVCLYNAERQILIAADHILPRISPHIGAHPSDPLDDPLGAFLRSLVPFSKLPDETLVLPSHGEPFHGLRGRVRDLAAHHEERLEKLLAFCREPRTVMDTLEILFRPLPTEQIGFGLSEALAHLRRLEVTGRMDRVLAGEHWLFTSRP
ncbi:MBL fold metallo-hydrolase [Azorhizobium oxalatiphilum]|uniref:MBL fold metallo-hydrolase n=1 Tax=Azorhizobium oxalatiphilum TaxID=980631 RepID=A0A917BPM6_9HYPH|nr:MBL fold metallo-hydrolase [Azorhizobium oxalatiphilum]GGF51383.1 MBL fold metallo-hydrolase [Azorhizobium oxalatiphilum]